MRKQRMFPSGAAGLWAVAAALWAVAAALALPLPAQSPARGPSQTGTVLDRVVAVVNDRAILESDVAEEMQLSVLDPAGDEHHLPTASQALEQLISRALIEQQIRQEDLQAAEPSQAEVDARLMELRKELPACVHGNCASDEGWKAFLIAHGLTSRRVERYMRYRLEILRFIEQRFRQGIQITPQEIAAYYRDTLLPQYDKGEKPPTLEKVSPRLEEILLQKQVNMMFEDWLNNLRKQGDVEVLDPALETPATQAPAGKGGA